jgi:hypothetical protein
VPRFSLHDRREHDDHRFEAYNCEAEGANLVEELGAAVQALYVDPAGLRDRLLEAAADIDGVADVDEIRAAIAGVADAAVPEAGVRLAQPQLDMARNELGEVIAYDVLEKVCGGVLPAKRVRQKETPTLPSRGLDALALAENGQLALLASEVKSSDDDASPPGVVGAGDSSLHAQSLSLLGSPGRLLVELNWAFKHAEADRQAIVARAILLYTRGDLPIVIVPVLVRPARCHGNRDFGIFENDPGSLAPATVQFCVVRLSDELDDLAQAVYRQARQVQ